MNRALVPTLIVGCLLALLGSCFGSVLFRNQQFCFRDAAHFYYPLYLRVQQEWEAGRWPLWEPEENGGMPLLGNPTAAVLYPGKLLYAKIPYAWGTRLYVVAHTVLAFAGMVVLLRGWQASWVASALAGLSYAFGAPILFQYCNIIFLVGAAWLPWGLRAVDRWLRLGKRGAILELAVVLGMQMLGGDPQAAYLTGLCAGGYAIGLAWVAAGRPAPSARRLILTAAVVLCGWVAAVLLWGVVLCEWGKRSKPLAPAVRLTGQSFGWIFWGMVAVLWLVRWRRGAGARLPGLAGLLAGLVAAAVLAAALTAAQLLPVLEFTRLSVRAAEEGPHAVYPFSLEPVRALELLWPNLFGIRFGVNHAWLPMVPPVHAPSTWVPSLYLGGLALLLALGAMAVRQGPPWRVWLTLIALVNFVACMGEFGSPIWWFRSVPAGARLVGPHDPPQGSPAREDGALHDGDGGFYWLLATTLPGFGSFRYPAKLFTLTALALSALAGLGWDGVAAGRRRRIVVLGAFLLALSLSAIVTAAVYRDRLVAAFAAHPVAHGGGIYGPFDPAGAVHELLRAGVHGTIVLGLGLVVVGLALGRPRLAGLAMLVLVTADLAWANAGLVLTMPQSRFEEKPRLLELIEKAEREKPSPGPFRIHRMPLWDPPGWYRLKSQERVAEMVLWERDTLQPKYAIPFHLSYTLTEGVTELYDYWWFFGGFSRRISSPQEAKYLGSKVGESMVYYPRRGFDLWTTRYFIVPVFANHWKDEQRSYAAFLPDSEPIAPTMSQPTEQGRQQEWLDWISTEDWQLLRNRDVYPRAWVVHDARRFEPIEGLGKEARMRPMEDLLFQNDLFWNDPYRFVYDPKKTAWLEVGDMTPLARFLPRTPTDPSESVRIVKYEPQCVEMTATLLRPGLVILADVLYPGWHLAIDGHPAPIWRVNRLMRGAAVDSGTHTLVYTYDPDSFRIGLWISGLALAFLGILTGWLIVTAGLSRRGLG